MIRINPRLAWMLGLAAFFALALAPAVSAQAVRVELRQTSDGWQLLRGGEPYRVQGAGGDQYLDQLAAAGGNSIRTWGVGPETRALLDEAHTHGLTVTVGIWLGHERHGFDYENLDQVAEQFDKVRAAVLEYKDHPALLAWGLGNEMEGYEQGDNPAIWSHVEACAAMVKRLDPDHPTLTVIAEIGGRKLESIHKLCPSIDIVGINTYGGAQSIPQRYAVSDITKPYIVTEFGPAGTWEVGRNSFDAPEELTSTAKGPIYRDVYNALVADAGHCLGSYAFLWGAKVEATSTWFGMYLPDGSKLAAVDAMTECWSGKKPADLCPVIESFGLDGTYIQEPGATVRVTLSAADPESDALDAVWVLSLDPLTYETAGDFVEAPPTFPDHIVSADAKGCELRLPDDGGVYRITVFVRDAAGNAATANLPLSAGPRAGAPGAGQSDMTPGKPAELPLVVYEEANGPSPWIASGYMGNGEAIAMDPASADAPHTGTSCIRVSYRAAGEWGGVVWQDPVNDWGDQAGGYNLTGATALEFWARGAKGGEVVNFGFGVLGADAKFPDSGKGELANLRLTDQWRKYRVEIGGDIDLQRIKTGFFWSLAGQGETVVFYLDDIRFVKDSE